MKNKIFTEYILDMKLADVSVNVIFLLKRRVKSSSVEKFI